jgi:hypothetical protein
MEFSGPRRTPLFADDPVGELRGLATLTDPDDEVAAVIDLAVIGARGDGKTQFIVHAIRALHAHAPAVEGAELDLNRDVMRLVLDPRATRPEATPPGVMPHFTFRMRTQNLFERIGWLGSFKLALRAARVGFGLVLTLLLVIGGVAAASRGDAPLGIVVGASGAIIGAITALLAKRRVAKYGDIEVVFWDIAGEQVYSAGAADYYAVLGRLVDARRQRAESFGRAYVFAPILICNPLALGTDEEGSPYERLRQLLPLFAALDSDAARTLVAINRWSIVDPICARGAPRDEVLKVTAHGRGEPPPPEPREVSREQVREHCLDAEDGRDGDVGVAYLRYDTALRANIDADPDAGTLTYEYDEGPGAFSGDARRRFLDWIVGLVRWPRLRAVAAPASVPTAATTLAQGSLPPGTEHGVPVAGAAPAYAPNGETRLQPTVDVWARPLDAPRPR